MKNETIVYVIAVILCVLYVQFRVWVAANIHKMAKRGEGEKFFMETLIMAEERLRARKEERIRILFFVVLMLALRAFFMFV